MQRRYENIRLEHNGIMPRESNKKKKLEKNKMKVLMLAVFTVNHSSPLWRMVNKN